MVAAVGGEVTYLKRLSMGTLLLDDNLEKGQYRPLTEQEINDLKK
jgi:16S rRNA pseudouridine516 synthase